MRITRRNGADSDFLNDSGAGNCSGVCGMKNAKPLARMVRKNGTVRRLFAEGNRLMARYGDEPGWGCLAGATVRRAGQSGDKNTIRTL